MHKFHSFASFLRRQHLEAVIHVEQPKAAAACIKGATAVPADPAMREPWGSKGPFVAG